VARVRVLDDGRAVVEDAKTADDNYPGFSDNFTTPSPC